MDLRWAVPIAWCLVMTGLVLWVWYQAGEDRQRLDALERDLYDQERPANPVDSPQDDREAPDAYTDTPRDGTDPHSGATGTVHIDLSTPPRPLPPVPGHTYSRLTASADERDRRAALPTEAMPTPEPAEFEPDPTPKTEPAIDRRRGQGRFAPGPGGSYVYQPPEEKR
jgi:hypothetical protein